MHNNKGLIIIQISDDRKRSSFVDNLMTDSLAKLYLLPVGAPLGFAAVITFGIVCFCWAKKRHDRLLRQGIIPVYSNGRPMVIPVAATTGNLYFK